MSVYKHAMALKIRMLTSAKPVLTIRVPFGDNLQNGLNYATK